MATTNTGQMGGIYKTLQNLIDTGARNYQRVELLSGERYQTDPVDSGSGVLLSTGNYANPIDTTDPQTAINTAAIAGLQIDNANDQVGTAYTLLPTDAEDTNGNPKTVWMNNAAANIVTIDTNANQAIRTNGIIMVMMEGVGVTSITAVAGVTLNGIDGGTTDIAAQFTGITLVQRTTDNWVITGSMGAVA